MTFGTVLTLFVVPTVYTLLARRRRGNVSSAPAAAPVAPAAVDAPGAQASVSPGGAAGS
jgi:hypothetical protein